MMFKSKKAFTLAEMMVVLLVLSIITAAFVPIMTKKVKQSASNSGSQLWHLVDSGTGAGSDIFSDTTAPTQGAAIGRNTLGGENTKLLINTSNAIAGQNHIVFQQSGTTLGSLLIDSNGNCFLGQTRTVAAGAVQNVAIGNNVTLGGSGTNGIAIGRSVSNLGHDGVAIGPNTVANSDGSIAISGNATGGESVAINGTTNGGSSIALNGSATGENAIAIGIGSKAQSDDTIAIGDGALSGNNHGITIGMGAIGTVDYPIAIGYKTRANSADVSIGDRALIGDRGSALYTGHNNVAIGQLALLNTTSGAGNTAVGSNACKGVVTGSYNVCIGTDATVASSVSNAISIGDAHTNSGSYGITIGYCNRAQGTQSIGIGTYAYVDQPYSIGIGNDVRVNEAYSMVLGSNANTDSNKILRLRAINTITSSVGIGTESDRRLKNIEGLSNVGLKEINKINIYKYTLKKDPEKLKQIGVVAQEIQKIMPFAITKNKADGYMSVNYDFIFCAAVNAVKELDKTVLELTKEFKSLVARVQTIDDKVIALVRVNQINSKKIDTLYQELNEIKKENKQLKSEVSILKKKVK